MNQKKEKVMPYGMKQLIALFNLFLDFNCMGLLCFMSDEPLPNREDLALMLQYSSNNSGDAGKVDGGQSIPKAQGILERAEIVEDVISKFGGIDNIRQSFAFFASLENEASKRVMGRTNKYSLLKDLSAIGTSKFPSIGAVAFHYHLRPVALTEKRKMALEQVAKDIYFKRRLTKEKAA